MLSQRTELSSSILALLAALLLPLQPIKSQHLQLGSPVIANYTKSDYRGGTQNWDGFAAPNGLLYFANNEGMLEFDGSSWKIFTLPRRTVLRSLYYLDSVTICAGGQGEVGYFRPDSKGNWVFNSLAERLPAGADFADIWEIQVVEGQLIFRASGKLFGIPLGDSAEGWVWNTDDPVLHFGVVEGQIYVHQRTQGIRTFDPQTQTAGPLAEEPILPDYEITAILPHPDGLLLTTIRKGIFLYADGEAKVFAPQINEFLSENRVYSAIQRKSGGYALASSTSGLVLLNSRGELQEIYDRRSGLQFNNTLCILEDLAANLWVGLDNGIDMIAEGSSYRRFYPDGELQGTAYAMTEFEGRLYCGTNNGLYVMDTTVAQADRQFELVPNTRGQVWGLQVIRGELLMGHHEGAFVIKGNRAIQLSNRNGAWLFQEIPSQDGKFRMVCGHYDGLDLYEWRNGWRMVSDIPEFKESSRLMALDHNGFLWIAHPYKGLWRLHFDNGKLDVVEMFNEEHGLPTNFGLKVFPLGDDLIVTTDQFGAWQLEGNGDRFIRHDQIDELVGKEEILAVLEGEHGDIWCITNPEVYRLKVVDQGLTKQILAEQIHELKGSFVGGFESLFELNKKNVFIATDRGFLHLVNRDKQERPGQAVNIRRVQCADTEDSLIYGGAGLLADNTSLPARFRTWRFDFAAPSYEAPDRLEYSWRLDGFDDAGWSDWNNTGAKEYTNLDAGSYRFEVKARDLTGVEFSPASFDFVIRRFWYMTPAAYIMYMLIVSAFLSTLIVAPRRKFARESARLEVERERSLAEQEARYQETVETSNREINALRAQKLQTEVDSQNKELAMTTMHLVQKNALITKVKDELSRLESSKDIFDSKKMARQLINMFESDNRLDEEWEQFELHFDKVHADFLARLRSNFPQLTPKDRKLCAFLRLNLSTKEIAPMLNISVRGVEISRYRLRKKLGLESEVNLVEYLMGI